MASFIERSLVNVNKARIKTPEQDAVCCKNKIAVSIIPVKITDMVCYVAGNEKSILKNLSVCPQIAFV